MLAGRLNLRPMADYTWFCLIVLVCNLQYCSTQTTPTSGVLSAISTTQLPALVALQASTNRSGPSGSVQVLQQETFPFQQELWRKLNNQFLYDRHSFLKRQWFADMDFAVDEYQASYMVHESLMTHVHTVRCPVYAMVFRWFQDERRDSRREGDSCRRVSRRIIQLLSYRAVVDYEFYHDVFFSSVFGSVVNQFMNVAERIEREATHEGQRETWFDLVGCLFEYGNMPPPNGPSPDDVQRLVTFLSLPPRRRMAMQYLPVRGSRHLRVEQIDLIRLRGLASAMGDFDLVSRQSIKAMMDPQTLGMYQEHLANQVIDLSLRSANKPSYPMWPGNEDSHQLYDPLRDFRPLPVQIYLVHRNDPHELAGRVSFIDVPVLEPHQSLMVRDANIMSVTPLRSRRQILTSIAMFYNLRITLIRMFEIPVGHSHEYMWSRLPIEAAIERYALSEILLGTRSSMLIGALVSEDTVHSYVTIGEELAKLRPENSYGIRFYKDIFAEVRDEISQIVWYFDTSLLKGLRVSMSGLTDLISRIKQAGIEVLDSGENNQASSSATSGDGSNRAPRRRISHPPDCTICLESLSNYVNDENEDRREVFKPVELNCGHKYHWSCIYKWFLQESHTRRCPICRA